MMPDVRFGVLTDGIVYHFYSDIDKPSSMDGKPFLELSMLDIHESLISWLERFTKDAFNPSEIIIAITELQYVHDIKRILTEEFTNPSSDFVTFFAKIKKLYSKWMTQSIQKQFVGRIKSACSEFINEQIGDSWNADLTKRTWDLLPPYRSKEFMDYLKAKGMTIEDFKTLPVYIHALKHGIIKEPPPSDPRLEFFHQLLERSNRMTQLFANVSPRADSRYLTAGGGKQGLAFSYVVGKKKARVEFEFCHSDPQLNKHRFELLNAKKDAIEASFRQTPGEHLEWDVKEELKHRYIRSTSQIGGLEDKEKWPQIQLDLVNRMVRLENALRPHLDALA
jgi:hypothetical protein